MVRDPAVLRDLLGSSGDRFAFTARRAAPQSPINSRPSRFVPSCYPPPYWVELGAATGLPTELRIRWTSASASTLRAGWRQTQHSSPVPRRPLQPRLPPFQGSTRWTKTILEEVEVRASDVSAAMREAAHTPWPPRAIGFRIVDHDGREVLGCGKAIADPDESRNANARRGRTVVVRAGDCPICALRCGTPRGPTGVRNRPTRSAPIVSGVRQAH